MYFEDLFMEYSFVEERQYIEEMTGWVKFQPILSSVQDRNDICKRITFEINSFRRADIILRLVQKYNKLQSQEVLNAWFDYYAGNRKKD